MNNERYGFIDDGQTEFKPKQCDKSGKAALEEVTRILEGAEETMDTFKEVQEKIEAINNGLGFTKEETETLIESKGYLTKEEVQSLIDDIEVPTLDEYAKTADVDTKIAEVNDKKQDKGDYPEYVTFVATRKTIQLENRDSISGKISTGGGANLLMLSGYEGLDFDVCEVGSTQTALVLNTCEGVVKIEDKEHKQKTIATIDEIEALKTELQAKIATLEDVITKLTMPSQEYAVEVEKEISAGGEVVLVKDVKIETGNDITLTKNNTIDLGGHKLSSIGGSYGDTCVVSSGAEVTISNGEIAPSDGASQEKQSATIIITTASASKLTLNNVKVTGIYPLYVNSANEETLVTINDCEIAPSPYFEDPDKCNPAVYVAKGSSTSTIGGKVIINSGVFGKKGVVNNYLLNVEDILRKQEGKEPRDFIEVKGGEYYNFNPMNNKAEGEGTNFVADGYKVEEIQDGEDTIYKVVKA